MQVLFIAHLDWNGLTKKAMASSFGSGTADLVIRLACIARPLSQYFDIERLLCVVPMSKDSVAYWYCHSTSYVHICVFNLHVNCAMSTIFTCVLPYYQGWIGTHGSILCIFMVTVCNYQQRCFVASCWSCNLRTYLACKCTCKTWMIFIKLLLLQVSCTIAFVWHNFDACVCSSRAGNNFYGNHSIHADVLAMIHGF